MTFTLFDALKWGWVLLSPIIGFFLLMLFKELERRRDKIQDHETRLAVLEKGQSQVERRLDEIKDCVIRIDEKMGAKADR